MRLVAIAVCSCWFLALVPGSPVFADQAVEEPAPTAAPQTTVSNVRWDLISLTFGAALQIGGVVSLVLAIWQLKQARDQTNELNSIRKSMSTRYVGQFPAYLPQILEVLESATESINVLCDFPYYGKFTDPAFWLRYEIAIRQFRLSGKEPKISITCLNGDLRRKFLQDQFINEGLRKERTGAGLPFDALQLSSADIESFWQKTYISPVREKTLHRFLDLTKYSGDLTDITYAQFVDHAEARNCEIINHGLDGIDIVELADTVPIYYWIADNKRAVFSIPTAIDPDNEQGFYTTDDKLIAALLKIGKMYPGVLRRKGAHAVSPAASVGP